MCKKACVKSLMKTIAGRDIFVVERRVQFEVMFWLSVRKHRKAEISNSKRARMYICFRERPGCAAAI